MDIRNLKKDIKNTFDLLSDQIDTITNSNDEIPRIEVDIALGNLRKLYEDLHVLNKMNESEPYQKQEKTVQSGKKPETKEPEKDEPEKKEPGAVKDTKVESNPGPFKQEKPLPEPQHETHSIPEETQNEKEETPPENKADSGNKKPSEEKQKAEKPQPVNKPRLPEEPKVTADLFSSSQSSIADKFMREQDKSLGAKMQKNKIADLKAAIAINQKFIFINELFDGDMQEYNNTIEQLNSFGTKEQAMAILSALRNRHAWDTENQAYQQFVDIIERRFTHE